MSDLETRFHDSEFGEGVATGWKREMMPQRFIQLFENFFCNFL